MRKLTDRQFTLAQAVQAHASAYYDEGGWDFIVECWSLDDIADVIGRARTAAGAIKKMAAIAKTLRDVHDDRTAEARRELEIGYADMRAEQAERRPALEPDGSVVKCGYSWDGELLSATRTWPGKVGHAEIAVMWEGGGEAPETYVPGWRGQVLRSDNYCTHDAPEGELCWSHDCRRPNCCPF